MSYTPESLTHAMLLAAFYYDPETGAFGRYDGKPATHRVGKYEYLSIGLSKTNTNRGLQRTIWFYMTGRWPRPGYRIESVDNNPKNLRWSNLREAPVSHIARKMQINRGCKGVGWHVAGKKWAARIRVGGKRKHLGLFDDYDEAHRAYLRAVEQLQP